jgi:DNA-repair protein XRCC3
VPHLCHRIIHVCRHQVAVVVVNHVVDCSEEGTLPVTLVALEQATGGRALRTSGRRVMPALGLLWAHCVTTRLFLSRATPAGALSVGDMVVRRMRVVFAPHLPPREAKFAVAANGVRGVEEDEEDDAPRSPGGGHE